MRSKSFERKINRQNAKEQGFYDGRFRSKVVENKKKKHNKNWARKKQSRDGNY